MECHLEPPAGEQTGLREDEGFSNGSSLVVTALSDGYMMMHNMKWTTPCVYAWSG